MENAVGKHLKSCEKNSGENKEKGGRKKTGRKEPYSCWKNGDRGCGYVEKLLNKNYISLRISEIISVIS